MKLIHGLSFNKAKLRDEVCYLIKAENFLISNMLSENTYLGYKTRWIFFTRQNLSFKAPKRPYFIRFSKEKLIISKEKIFYCLATSSQSLVMSVWQNTTNFVTDIPASRELWQSHGKIITSIGICGATSTPNWLMEQVAEFLQKNEPQLV